MTSSEVRLSGKVFQYRYEEENGQKHPEEHRAEKVVDGTRPSDWT